MQIGAQRGILETRKADCHICTAGAPTKRAPSHPETQRGPKERRDLKSGSQSSRSLAQEVRTSRERTRDEDERNSSAKLEQSRNEAKKEESALQPLER